MDRNSIVGLMLAVLLMATACAQPSTSQAQGDQTMQEGKEYEVAVLGAGCFWCIEAIFEELKGVVSVESGYTGGSVKNPSYADVTSGRSGHAEVAKISYDPQKISFDEILEVFWETHDPTTLNRQGADRGTQYRSAVFYADESQRDKAEYYKKQLDESGAFADPIVTEIVPLGDYYPAEDYHQDYYTNNPDQRYCAYVVRPKLEKFRKAFADKLKVPAKD